MTSDTVELSGVPEGCVVTLVEQHREASDGSRVPIKGRKGRRKITRVRLHPVVLPTQDAQPVPAVERFVLGADTRRWTSVKRQFGADAWPTAVDLVIAGVVTLDCEVTHDLRLGEPIRWALTEPWRARRQASLANRTAAREQWASAAADAAEAVRTRCPELAAAIRASRGSGDTSRLAVFVAAAQDLIDGVRHAGPRAFSQAHFGATKARDDVHTLLRQAGVPAEILDELGIHRSSRIGVAGPISAQIGDRHVGLEALAGPVLLRADQPRLQLSLHEPVVLVVVENLQASEVAADQLPQLGIVYTAGVPATATLKHIGALAAQARRTVIVCDADLGGVRIAEHVLRVVPDAQAIDIGTYPHPPREPFTAASVSIAGLTAALEGPAADLAQAVLTRGYPVEQELATTAALRSIVADTRPT